MTREGLASSTSSKSSRSTWLAVRDHTEKFVPPSTGCAPSGCGRPLEITLTPSVEVIVVQQTPRVSAIALQRVRSLPRLPTRTGVLHEGLLGQRRDDVALPRSRTQ